MATTLNPRVAVGDDGMAAIGLPGTGSVAAWNTATGQVTRLSTAFDAGLFAYGESVAVPNAFNVVGIGVASGVNFAELRLPDGGVFDRPQATFALGTNNSGTQVSLSGDGRTFAWSVRAGATTREIWVRRPAGATTSAFDVDTTYADDFELDATGQRLSTFACRASPAACRLRVHINVPANITTRWESDPLSFTNTSTLELEASSDATWVALGDATVDTNKGRWQVFHFFGTGYEIAYTHSGVLTQEAVGRALAMDGSGTLLAVSNGRTRSTSIFVQRAVDGGVEYCEAQVLDAYASTGKALGLNASGTRLVMAAEDGGIQLFTR